MHVNEPFSLVWWSLSLVLLNHFLQSPMMRALQTWMQLWVRLSRSEPFFKHAAMFLEWGCFIHIRTVVLVYNSVVETNWYSIEESIHPECRTFQLTKVHQAKRPAIKCWLQLILLQILSMTIRVEQLCVLLYILSDWCYLCMFVEQSISSKYLFLCVAYSYICVCVLTVSVVRWPVWEMLKETICVCCDSLVFHSHRYSVNVLSVKYHGSHNYYWRAFTYINFLL